MSTFDDTTAYKAKGDGQFFDDGRETALLHHLYRHPSLSTLRNNPTAILSAIDAYARQHNYLMNIGSAKGSIVTSRISSLKSHNLAGKPYITMVELGAYVGYSTVLFADALKTLGRELGLKESEGQIRFFSLERDPVFAAVTASIVDLAGLSDVVKVIVGPSDEGIRRLVSDGRLDSKDRQIDVLFLDHYKPAYTTDLKLCEELGIIRVPESNGKEGWRNTGTLLCADNVVEPGNPPYLEYVRSTVAEKRTKAGTLPSSSTASSHTNGHTADTVTNGNTENKPANGDTSGIDTHFQGRARDMYAHREGDTKLDATRRGDPGIVYKSELVESFEPTGERDGVEVTWCVGRGAS